MSSKKFVSLAVLMLSLLLVACGGGETVEEAPASSGASIDVVMNDIYYGDSPTNAEEPPVWTVPAGAQVSVNMDNNGGLEHNWAIVRADATVPEFYDDAENRDIILTDTGIVDPNSTFSAAIVAPEEAGEYTIICTVAGHYPSMQGRLVVTEQ